MRTIPANSPLHEDYKVTDERRHVMARKLRFAKGFKGSFGNVSFPAETFEPQNTRIRISIMIPGDVLDALRIRAAREGLPYQTLTNQILRRSVSVDLASNSRKSRRQRKES